MQGPASPKTNPESPVVAWGEGDEGTETEAETETDRVRQPSLSRLQSRLHHHAVCGLWSGIVEIHPSFSPQEASDIGHPFADELALSADRQRLCSFLTPM